MSPTQSDIICYYNIPVALCGLSALSLITHSAYIQMTIILGYIVLVLSQMYNYVYQNLIQYTLIK